MESMSIDPAVVAIGSRLVDAASRGLGSGAAALPSLTALAPAGAEEVSMQAATAFAAEAEALLALNTAAQEELARAGAAVADIARMYSQVDGEAAGALMAGGSRFAGQAFAGGVANAGGLLRAEALPGIAGSPARTPLMANLIEGVAANPSTTVPAAANAASTALSAGTAPLSSIGSMASTGATGPRLTSLDRQEEGDEPAEGQPGERLL